MSDRFSNLDFDVPELPKRKPAGGLTIGELPVVTMETITTGNTYTLQTLQDLQAAIWDSRSWKRI